MQTSAQTASTAEQSHKRRTGNRNRVINGDAEPVLLRERDAIARYGVSKSWFRELVSHKILPAPKKLGERLSFWDRATLDAAFADENLSRRIAEHSARRREAIRADAQKRISSKGAVA